MCDLLVMFCVFAQLVISWLRCDDRFIMGGHGSVGYDALADMLLGLSLDKIPATLI